MRSKKDISVFSPFSPAMLWEKRNRALLIQFLAAELIETYRALYNNAAPKEILSLEKRFFPYDWAYPYGHLNKACEHASLLEHFFPELIADALYLEQLFSKNIASFKRTLRFTKPKLFESLTQMFVAVEPFLEKCKENENLIFFLLKHKKEIDQLMNKDYLRSLLLRFHPGGFSQLCEKLCDNYHHRGFYFLIPEIRRLSAELEHEI